MPKVSQDDIAKALNISRSTVGLVVGHTKSPLRQRLSRELVEKILAKADELGYEPSRAAQMMRSGRSNLIVYFSMAGHTELSTHRTRHFSKMIPDAGFEFQSYEHYWWPDAGERLLDQVLGAGPEGMIVAYHQFGSGFTKLQRSGVPFVALGQKLPGAPWVRYDAHAVMRQFTLSMIGAGRKRIGILLRNEEADPCPTWQTREKLRGFREACVEAGWGEPEQIAHPRQIPSRGKQRAMILLDTPRRASTDPDPFAQGVESAKWIGDRVDALICSNDFYAIGALTHYQRTGIAVPDQIAISGFDNLTYTNQGLIPITTVRQPTEAMGTKAFELLQGLIKGSPPEELEHVFPCEIIWRESMPHV